MGGQHVDHTVPPAVSTRRAPSKPEEINPMRFIRRPTRVALAVAAAAAIFAGGAATERYGPTVAVPTGTALQAAAGDRFEVIYDGRTGVYTVEPRTP
jgi:hypothetical protein